MSRVVIIDAHGNNSAARYARKGKILTLHFVNPPFDPHLVFIITR
jgi:hypothetical protein